MINIERKKIETSIRALQFARAEEAITPFTDRREQVLRAVRLRQGGDVQANLRKKRIAGLRVIRSAALAAACLLIVVSVYSALAPVPVSNANSFLRRAQILIGGVLKVNVSVEPPEKRGALPGASRGNQEEDTALKEAHEALGLTVLMPTQLPGGMTLGEIKTSGADDTLSSIQYSYQGQDNMLIIFIEEIADSMGMSFNEETIEYLTPVGTFFVWGSDTGWFARAISGNSSVFIRGTMDKDAFMKILDSLREID